VNDSETMSAPLMPVAQGHLASVQTGLNFVNTLDLWPTPHDHLDTAQVALEWLVDNDLLHREARAELLHLYEGSPGAGRAMLARLRRVRDAMRSVLEATATHRPPDAGDLAEINRALRTHYIYELVQGPDGVSLGHRHQGDPVDGAAARLAESIARELTQGPAARLRVCENEQCRWVFKDTSPTGKRKWCSMRSCGNRAKVARHRARRKAVGV
jgi:predicted RNA-binding Zn ribbon-like protein